jgi:2-succinyl-6-hydroxy-2,4-cyclohexadiene-1-carboxylate synthase
VSELALHVERRGSGPSLVLSHGFGGSARNFRPQVRALSTTHEVVVYDTRGHARSPAPLDPAEYREAELVGDLLRMLESARPPAILGGLSLGAYTALRAALAAPERTRGLVLASFPSSEQETARNPWALGFADAIEQEGLERAGERFVWGERSRFDDKARDFIRRGLLEHAPHALVAILRNVLAHIPRPDELGSELSRLDLPVLVVVGSEDTPALGPCERLAALLPRAELVVVPGAGHVVNLAAPEAFNRLLASFVQKLA